MEKRPFYKSDEKTELSIGEISINNNEGNIKIILDSDLIPLFIENGDSEKELFVKCRHKNEETYLVKDKDYLIISHKDKKGVAIYISIPEYMADPEIEIPLANYKIPKVNTGHVGNLTN